MPNDLQGIADECGACRFGAGCPPTSEALIYGILQLQNKIARTNTIARA